MRMKYFYDCPLKAAYMAKYYGMRFIDDDGYLVSSHEVLTRTYLDENGFHPCYEREKDYIHPDSLHLLEPVEGDLVQCYGLLSTVTDKMAKDHDGMNAFLNQGGKIIQRNNQPFFWPESEEVCV